MTQIPLHTIPEFPIETGFSLMHTSPPDMLIGGLLPSGSVTLIAGPTYSGKTFFALELARAVTHEVPFMDHFPVLRPGNVLFIEQDSPKYDTARAFWSMLKRTYTYSELHHYGELHALKMAWHPSLNLKEQLSVLSISKVANAQSTFMGYESDEYGEPTEMFWSGCKLIILDTFRSLHSAEENSSTEMAVIMQRIKEIRERTQSAILLIHHGPKDPLDLLGVRGSSAIEAAVDTIFRISSNKKTKLSTVRVVKARAVRPPDFHYEIKTWIDPQQGEMKSVTFAGLVETDAPPPQEEHYAPLLSHLRANPGASHKELLKWAVLNAVSPRTLDRWLSKMLEDKRVQKTKEKDGTRYFPLDTPASRE